MDLSARARTLIDGHDLLDDHMRSLKRSDLLTDILDSVSRFRATAEAAYPLTASPDKQPPSPAGAQVTRRVASSTPLPGHMVTCENLTWRAGHKTILHVDLLNLYPGTVVGVVGPNGAGKTTLLRLLASEISPSEGEIAYTAFSESGLSSGRVRDRLGYVRQIPRRFDGTVARHLSFFASMQGLQGSMKSDQLEFVSERFGLADVMGARWSELAGGYRTRVDLARVVLCSPDLLLLDEPLGPLDHRARDGYLRHLRDLADSRRQICVVVSSHDLHAIETVADQIIALDRGAAVFDGPPEQIKTVLGHRRYEFRTAASEASIRGATSRLPRAELEGGEGSWTLQLSVDCGARQVLEALIACDEDITYFRDLSNSASALYAGSPKAQE